MLKNNGEAPSAEFTAALRKIADTGEKGGDGLDSAMVTVMEAVLFRKARPLKDLIPPLRRAARETGRGGTIGMGTMFYLDMRRWMLDRMETCGDPRILKTGMVGKWMGHPLRIIRGSVMDETLDEPRKWESTMGRTKE